MSEEPLPVCGPEMDVISEIVDSKLSTCHCEIAQAYTSIRSIEPRRLAADMELTFFVINRSRQCIPRMQVLGLDKRVRVSQRTEKS